MRKGKTAAESDRKIIKSWKMVLLRYKRRDDLINKSDPVNSTPITGEVVVQPPRKSTVSWKSTWLSNPSSIWLVSPVTTNKVVQ